jgi:molybdopterin converting factor small subunit
MPTLTVPTPLRPYTEGTSNIDLHSTDVRGAVQELVSKYPALDPHLFTEDGSIRPYVNLFVNDEDVRYLHGLDTELNVQDQLRIVPSIAGGNNHQLI